MLFNSLAFLVFFPVVTIVYWALPSKWRWLHLLLASCYFYMFFIPIYLLVLVFTIVVDYWAGLLIAGAGGYRRKLYLTASIAANVGVLAFFKYYNFLNGNAVQIADVFGLRWPMPFLDIVLPIGLSFHTFQAMSYTIEVYRGRQAPERHFGIYALYVMFYPQLVAGPIERPQKLLHQFYAARRFDGTAARDGLRLMLLGFIKKVVVADRVASVVNVVYDHPEDHGALALALATLLFAVQIYADFSGYSDIARGAARFMGFELMVNFNRPYLARSVSEFWKRWHISLSTWFRDYVYISLGGNRVGWTRWQLNLFITFVLSGLWHGANWTFVIWGALNGLYLVVANWTARWRQSLAERLGLVRHPALRATLQIAVVFLLENLAWVYFRARTVKDAHRILGTMISGVLTGRGLRPREALASLLASGLTVHLVAGAVGAASALLVFDWLVEHHIPAGFLDTRPTWIRWSAYYVGVTLVLIFGSFGERQFIYFQF